MALTPVPSRLSSSRQRLGHSLPGIQLQVLAGPERERGNATMGTMPETTNARRSVVRLGGRRASGGDHGPLSLLLLGLLVALPGSALSQATNQILSISPTSAPQGTTGLLLTFTLDTDFPPPPPAGDGPQSVSIGSLSGTAITHASANTVTAIFTVPAGESPGPQDAALHFSIPGGTLVFSKAGAFTITATETYTIERTLSDGAQRNTIAFDGLAFLTGNLGGQSFLPPGKVADYSGFQYLRDNDPTSMGHNTDFVTIIAFNVLHILTEDQIAQLVARAQSQVELINEYAYRRFPLMKAFRRLVAGDVPQGSGGLDKSAVMAYSAELYRVDGQISYDRAQLLGGILRSLTPTQIAALEALKALNGVGNWNRTLSDPLQSLHLQQDVNVAVMTYASEMYSWYAGSVEADVYFCPERQGTYFGSFYLKDWPAMGNPNYTIDEQLTARAGEDFLTALADSQAALVTGLVDVERADLYEIVATRRDISLQLRRFMTSTSIDSVAVMALSERYGELDGAIVYSLATNFVRVHRSLDSVQRAALTALADSLGYVPASGAFLYSQPIGMPAIIDTDFLFSSPPTDTGAGPWGSRRPGSGLCLRALPNPTAGKVVIGYILPVAGRANVMIYDARGRLVRRLATGVHAAGEHEVSWDGGSGSGCPLPTGLYFVELETAAGTRHLKLTVAR
jgi:hypothetical protein